MEEVDDMRERLQEVEEKVEHLTRQLRMKEIRPVRAVAEEDNAWPDSYDGLKSLMERLGVPLRDRGGRLKPKGSRKTSYVSMFELRQGERLNTRSVQSDAGLR